MAKTSAFALRTFSETSIVLQKHMVDEVLLLSSAKEKSIKCKT